MELLILCARPETASNRRLVDAAAKAGVRCRLVDATELTAESGGRLVRQTEDLLDRLPDALIVRIGNWRPDSLLALLEVATARGVPTPNPAPAFRIGRDHWRTAQVLAMAGIPAPITVAGADPGALAAAATRLGFPVVVKQRRSRMGVGVIRCSAADHLEAVLDSLWRLGDEVVVQQYHETGGRSLRLLVVGDRVVAAARFDAAAGDWRSNAARGGSVAGLYPCDEEVELALAATRAVGLEICGVDLLPSADGVVVGEVNPTPGFVSLENATGVDVAREIIAHVLRPRDETR